MALTIRLRQLGRKNQRCYRLVVTDSRTPRDGKYLEAIGWYNPAASDQNKTFSVKPERAAHWLALGAEISERAKTLIARGAPDVIREYTDKQQAHRVKMAAKRRDKRREKAAK